MHFFRPHLYRWGRILSILLGSIPLLQAQSPSPRNWTSPALIFDNPAHNALDSTSALTVHWLSVDSYVGSQQAALKRNVFSTSLATIVRDQLMGQTASGTGWGEVDFKGPSVSWTLAKDSKIALLTRMRVMGSYTNIDGRLVSEIGEVDKVTKSYPYTIEMTDMHTNATAFSELAVALSKPLYKSERHQLAIGGTFKLVNGSGHTAIQLPSLVGTIDQYRQNDDLVFLSDAQGMVSTHTSGGVFDQFTMGNALQVNKVTGALDIGFQYRRLAVSPNGPQLMIGVAVTDIGVMKFAPSNELSKEYAIDITQDEKLFFNTHFDNADFSKTAEVYERYPEFFTPLTSFSEVYKVRLPTTLKLQLSVDWTDRFSTDMYVRKQLNNSNQLHQLRGLEWISIAPQWKKGHHRLRIPLTYTSAKSGLVGLTYSYKGFWIGSRSLANMIFSSSKVIDFSVGITTSLQVRK